MKLALRLRPAVGRYAHIDALRAFAVLLVVVAHAGVGHIVPGGAGVTVFFAISGFIITTLVLKESQKTGQFDIGGFYIRRAVKLLPPLFVVLLIPTVVYDLLGGSISWSAVASQVLFYYNWIKLDHPDVFPGSAVVWSLSIEEQFYIVFALLWIVLVRSKRASLYLGVVAALAVVTSTALRFVLASPGSEAVADRIYYGSDTRADSIAWGILAAIMLNRWRKTAGATSRAERFFNSDWAVVLAILVFVLSLVLRDDFFRQTVRYSLQSISTCVIVIYGFGPGVSRLHQLFDRFCRVGLLQIIGLASYSIYLVHFSITQYIVRATEDWPRLLTVAVASVVAVAAGVAIYRIVEVPSRAYYERFRAKRALRPGGGLSESPHRPATTSRAN